MPREPERTVAVQRRVGLGDVLLSNCAAWRFAHGTGRTLLLDWRVSAYVPGRVNLFTELFEPITRWGGVPVRVASADDPWEKPALLSDRAEIADGAAACAAIRAGHDLADDHVRWVGCLAPAHPGRRRTAALLGELTLRPHLAAALADARAGLLGEGHSIGVHLRHGNGGNILAHGRYWTDGMTLHRMITAVRRARSVLGEDTPVLVATDSEEVLAAMTALVPGVRSLSKTFRPAGEGELHLWRQADSALEATFVEMFLLAHTTALIRMPPDSYFSMPAAVLKPPAPIGLLARRPSGLDPAVW